MRRLCLLMLLLPTVSRAEETPAKPFLVFDAGGHTAPVTQALFTPDGKHIVTVSHDKTARIWDVATGEALHVLRPPIGPGPEGGLLAAAISQDGKRLAVAGTGIKEGDKLVVLVHVFALATGQIDRTLKGHASAVHALAFAPDGKRLASGSDDGRVLLWDVERGQRERTLEGHESAIHDLAFSPDGKRLATASRDRTARIWLAATGKSAHVFKDTDEIRAIVWSPDGETVAIGSSGGHPVRLWKLNGKEGKPIPMTNQRGHTEIRGLRFTPDSQQLLAIWHVHLGGGFGIRGASVLAIADGKYREGFVTGDYGTEVHGDLSPDGQFALTASGNHHETWLWKTADGTRVRQFVARSRTPFRVGWRPDGKTLGWGIPLQGGKVSADSPLHAAFDLSALGFTWTGRDFARFEKSRPSRDGLSLEQAAKPEDRLKVKKGDEVLADLKLHGLPSCFSLMTGDRALVGVGHRVLLFNAHSGELLREFHGANGQAWDVVGSADGHYLLAACNDQTLRIWAVGRAEPLVSLCFAGPDWVAWTPEGYYAASPGGEKLMGWQINNGTDAVGTFYPAARFHASLYYPEVIQRLLKEGSLDKAVEAADKLPGAKRGVRLRVEEVLPPKVTIAVPTQSRLEIKEPKVQVKAIALPGGKHPVTSLRLLLDERPYQGSKSLVTKLPEGKSHEVEASWTVEVPPGTHRLRVLAETAVSAAPSHMVEVTYAGAPSTSGPSLYVLAIGINTYPGNLKLTWAVKDATDLEQIFKRKARPPFGQVETLLLTDGKATARGVLTGLDWLKRKMTAEDTAVIFYAGHGHKDKATGQFYLVPQDVDVSKLTESAVSGDEIRKRLIEVPGRVLVLLDACHSGAIGGSRPVSAAMTEDLRRKLTADECGIVVMCAAMASEEAGEDKRIQHGYFTKALLEGLDGKSFRNREGFVHLTGLHAYVEDKVEELSKNEQHAVIDRPTTVRSFPLTKP